VPPLKRHIAPRRCGNELLTHTPTALYIPQTAGKHEITSPKIRACMRSVAGDDEPRWQRTLPH
jgi:hypothetical protein